MVVPIASGNGCVCMHRQAFPGFLINATMDQVLDAVATTFEGIVVCSACAEQRWYAVYFAQVRTDLRR